MIEWRQGRSAIAGAALLSLALTVGYGLWGEPLWDFATRCDGRDTFTYYYAAKAALAGLNPYDSEGLQAVFGRVVFWVYTPAGLIPFAPLALLPPVLALLAFNLAKAAALVGLALVWRRLFPAWRGAISFWLVVAIAMNATLLQDLCSGNIAVFETLALWSAVLCCRGGKFALAALLLGIMAAVKPIWIVLLPLPLLFGWRDRPAWRAVAASIAVVAGALLLWLAIDPSSMRDWLRNIWLVLPIRYNAMALGKDLRLGLGGSPDLALWRRPEVALYLAWCGAVGVLLWRRRRAAFGDPLRGMLLLVLAFLSVSLANLSYSWLIGVPAIYAALLCAAWPLRVALLAAALAPGPLLGWVLPYRDIAMVALVAAMLGFVALALQTPHRDSSVQTTG